MDEFKVLCPVEFFIIVNFLTEWTDTIQFNQSISTTNRKNIKLFFKIFFFFIIIRLIYIKKY